MRHPCNPRSSGNIQIEERRHIWSFGNPQALKADSFHISKASLMHLSWPLPTCFVVSFCVISVSQASIYVVKESHLLSLPRPFLSELSAGPVLPGFLACSRPLAPLSSVGPTLNMCFQLSASSQSGHEHKPNKICATLASAAHVIIKTGFCPFPARPAAW